MDTTEQTPLEPPTMEYATELLTLVKAGDKNAFDKVCQYINNMRRTLTFEEDQQRWKIEEAYRAGIQIFQTKNQKS